MVLTLHTLKPSKGATRRRKRLGRGNASGFGSYSTKGQKGQRARTGGRGGLKKMGLRRLVMSIPKVRGFRSLEARFQVISVGEIEKAVSANEKITRERLIALKLLDASAPKVKILGGGSLTKRITVVGIPVSASAREKIIAAGGIIQ